MSLFFQITSAGGPVTSFFGGRRGLRWRAEAETFTYLVLGVYVTGSGVGGSVNGKLSGSPNPLAGQDG